MPRRRTVGAVALAVAIGVAVPLADIPGHEVPPAKAAPKARAADSVDAAEATKRARATGKKVEVTAERTARMTTWAQPDGTMVLRSSVKAVRAFKDGRWQNINTALERVDGGFSPKATNDSMVFSAGTHAGRASRTAVRKAALTAPRDGGPGQWSALVQFTTDGHQLTVNWPGAVPAPQIDGPRALYREILPGIDLLLTARDEAFSHLLVVKNRAAADNPALADLTYRLDSPDLAFTLDPTTLVVHATDSTGTEMAAAPTPYMWDSAGRVAATDSGANPNDDGGSAPTATGTPTGTSIDTLLLPGLAGPQPGTHDAVAQARLHDGTLTLVPDRKLLADEDTVYPVFVDPSFKGHTNEWALAYSTQPRSNFLNGQNFNDGTDEARVGHESTTGGTSRSFFEMGLSKALAGSNITSAKFYALETYAWSCNPQTVELWRTDPIDSSTTWANQPRWSELMANPSVAHGYTSSGCPDDYVAFDISRALNDVIGSTTLTLGLRANESSSAAWKKFQANGENSPYIELWYNHPPTAPTLLPMVPGPGCDTTPDPDGKYASVGKSDVTFSAQAKDVDGNLSAVHIKLWPTGGSPAVFDADLVPNSAGVVSTKIPLAKFTNGKTYSWQVWAADTWGAKSPVSPAGGKPCQFLVDSSAPNSPVVTSAQFPAPGDDGAVWSTDRFGTSGTFTFGAAGSTDTKAYEYSFNGPAFSLSVSPSALGGSSSLNLKPPVAGPNTLFVRTVDTAGNRSTPTKYLFYVMPRTTLDAPGDTTGDGFPDLYTINTAGELRVNPTDAAGDIDSGMPAAYQVINGKPEPAPAGYFTDTLITHNGDWLPGDGIQDLLVRKGSKLLLMPGDGYGGFDIGEAREVLLPTNAPAPSDLTQILATGDITGDGKPDAFATAGDALWVFTGYTGASFTSAQQLTSAAWSPRDIIFVGDITGDGAVDMLFRNNAPGDIRLRRGKKVGSTTDLNSLASGAASSGGVDTVYTDGLTSTVCPFLMGSPDANADGIPDFYARMSDGQIRYYHGGRTTVGVYGRVIQPGDSLWSDRIAFG